MHHDQLKLYIGEQTFSLTYGRSQNVRVYKKKQKNKKKQTNKYTKETQIVENFGMVEIAFSKKIYLYMHVSINGT